jgi:hypothetical protein
MSEIFYRNIALALVSIAVILIMASLNVNAPSLSAKIRLIRPRPNSPRMETVVVAEVDAVVEATPLVKAMAMMVIKPTFAASGRAMILCYHTREE